MQKTQQMETLTNDSESEQPSDKDALRELGATKLEDGIRLINIIGQIEGHTLVPPQNKATKYEHLIPLLAEMEQDQAVKGILIILNTMGGDVEAGLAIAELIRSMSKPSVSLVLGGGHSIGVPLAVSSDYSFIVPTACMTVHPLRTNGLFITSPQSFEYYLKMQERILRFISENANISQEQIQALMNNKNQMADDIGTVLIGAQAVDVGIIDEVGGLAEALHKLRNLCGQE